MNLVYIFLMISFCYIIITKQYRSVHGSVESVFNKDNSMVTKAIAALMIMYGHTAAAMQESSMFDYIDSGWHWVALFFFWSGYGVIYGVKTKKNYLSGYMWNRCIKVLIPFMTAHILYFILKTLTGATFTLKDIGLGLLGQLNIVEFSWYPIAALIMYIIFYALWMLPISERLKILFLFISIIILCFVEYLILGSKKDWWFISNLAFPLGVCLYYTKDYLQNKLLMLVSGVMFYFIGLMLVPVFNYVLGTYTMPIYIIASNIMTSAMAFSFIIACSAFPLVRLKFLKFVSVISYEVYLVHGLIIYLLKLSPITNPYLFMLIVIIGTLLLGTVMYNCDNFIIKKLLKLKNANTD